MKLSDDIRAKLERTPHIGEKTIAAIDRQIDDAYKRGRREGEAKRDASELATARRVIARVGVPPPGEGRHPLQGHRDSMG